MIPRLRPTLGASEFLAAFTRASSVGDFERRFAQAMGQRHALAFGYGRTGLMLLMEALGLSQREVICPAYTCVVVPHAIVHSGNRPVFVDSQSRDFNMDLDQAEAAITDKTGALVATSVFGYPVDLDKLAEIKARHPQVHIIQDCAHSFGAAWERREVQKEGIAAVFGLNFSKLITSIFGGMITTDDDALYQRLKDLRDARLSAPTAGKDLRRLAYLCAGACALSPVVFGAVKTVQSLGLIDRFVEYYDENMIDMPTDYLEAMSRVEASVGVVQTDRYKSVLEHRQRNAALYDQLLGDCAGLRLPPLVDGATYSHYVPCVDDRDAVMQAMLKRGIELGHIIEYSIPSMAAYAKDGGPPPSFPIAEEFAGRVVNLPLHVDVGEVERIASQLRQVLEG